MSGARSLSLMGAAPKPADEAARLAVLRRYAVLDTDHDPSFDRIAMLVQRNLDVPIALVSLVDAERQWFKACIGLDGRETSRDVAFCAHAILASDVFEVPDALADPRFRDNPLVTGAPHIRAYLGAPLITEDNFKLGTLCAIDTRPREFTPAQIATLVDLAKLVVDELELRRTARDRKLFERITDTSPNMMYVVDVKTRELVWASRPGPEGSDTLVHRDGLHPDDVEAVAAHAARRRTLADHELVELVFRMRAADGGYRWLLTRERVFERAPDAGTREVVGVAIDITALKQAEEKLETLALTDTLTGLANRRALDARLELLGHEARRGRRYSVAIVDIDHFKKVNDTHGHAMGDRVLVAVAQALRDSVRKHDLAARMGGEEFCVVQTDVDPEQVGALTERLRAAIEAIVEPLAVTASIGVCHSSLALATRVLLETADAALYRAKQGGRNRVEVASEPVVPEPAPAARG